MREPRSVLISIMLSLAIVALPTVAMALPTNDDFANAHVLDGTEPTVAGTNIEATREAGEPDHANAEGAHSVWYRWTAPETFPVKLSLCDSDFDTALAVYTGDAVDALTQVGANDDSGTCFPQSSVKLSAQTGTTYQIAVDGAWEEEGNFFLEFIDLRPPNDSFEQALPLSGYSARVSGGNAGAGSETGEPAAGYRATGRTVWFRWTAPTGGVAVIDTCRSDFDTVLAVYTGNDVTTLTRIGSGDDRCGKQSRVVAFVAAGTVYRIQVDGAGANPTGKAIVRVAIPRTGKYAGRTEFLDRKPISFELASNGRSVKRLTVTSTLGCYSGGVYAGELKINDLVFKPISVRKGATGGIFSRTGKVFFNGGGALTVFVSGVFQAPEKAKGKLRATAKFPSGTCKTFPKSIRWTAHR